MTTEEWKEVSGFEGKYQISTTGLVKSMDRFVPSGFGSERPIKGCLIKQGEHPQGYRYVLFSDCGKSKKFLVHRLVAMTFIDNLNYYPQVNHLDGNKSNNDICNLEWVTAQQNCHHAIANKLYVNAKGINCSNAKLNDDIVRDIRKQAASGIWHKILAAQYGIGRKAVTKIVNLQRWKHVV